MGHQFTDSVCYGKATYPAVKYPNRVFCFRIQVSKNGFKENKKAPQKGAFSNNELRLGNIFSQTGEFCLPCFAMITIVALIMFDQQTRLAIGRLFSNFF